MKNPVNVPLPQENNGCIKSWEEDLKKTTNKLKRVSAEKNRYSDKFTNAANWEDKLKRYWDGILVTEELAKKVASEIDLFKDHTAKVCDNTDCTVDAVKILFCYVRDLFQCTDELNEYIAVLLTEIKCLDPSLNAKSSIIIGCLKSISDKLNEAILKQQEVLKKMIQILQYTFLLHESICSPHCSLKWQLGKLSELFPKTNGNWDDRDDCQVNESCNASIEPRPELPIGKDVFYNLTKNQHGQSVLEKDRIRKELDEWRLACEALLSCQASLKEALDTSRAVKECK